MNRADHITDHAVMRYLELVYGFNVDFFRNRIDLLTRTAIELGSTGVTAEGVKFVIRDGRVTSVIERHQRSCDRRTGWSDDGKLTRILENLHPTDAELVELMVRPGEPEATAD